VFFSASSSGAWHHFTYHGTMVFHQLLYHGGFLLKLSKRRPRMRKNQISVYLRNVPENSGTANEVGNRFDLLMARSQQIDFPTFYLLDFYG
jgi:hypothetical protein